MALKVSSIRKELKLRSRKNRGRKSTKRVVSRVEKHGGTRKKGAGMVDSIKSTLGIGIKTEPCKNGDDPRGGWDLITEEWVDSHVCQNGKWIPV